MKKFIIGVDVGGTNIKIGMVSARGRIISRTNLSTEAYVRDKKKLISAIVTGIQNLLSERRYSLDNISGVGFGFPGLVDPIRGIVKFLPNIPGWKNVPFVKIFQQKMSLRAVVENDVNLITLGEWKFGAGAGVRNMLCMTLGTGVGAGLILNNALYRGAGYAAGEMGHVPLNEDGPSCNCGGWGCLERYVGNRALYARALKLFKRKITLEEISSLAARGNRKALKFWDETALHVGNGLTGVVNLLNPARIVIGGGVFNASAFMVKRIEKTLKARAMSVQGAMAKIVKAQLGADAGIVGARVLLAETIKDSDSL